MYCLIQISSRKSIVIEKALYSSLVLKTLGFTVLMMSQGSSRNGDTIFQGTEWSVGSDFMPADL